MSYAFLVHHPLELHAQQQADRLFVIDGPRRWTYAEINAHANAIALVLRTEGVAVGDRVILAAANSAFYVAAYYATLKLGAVAVPVNVSIDPKSMADIVLDCDKPWLLVGPGGDRLVRRTWTTLATLPLHGVFGGERLARALEKQTKISVIPTEPAPGQPLRNTAARGPLCDQDLAAIIYTSGSSGKPRGVMLSHLNLLSNAQAIVDYLQLSTQDRVLAILPFYYVYGQSVLNTHALVGGSLVIENRFMYPDRALDTLEEQECTGLSGVPSTFTILLNRSSFPRRELRTLRYVTQAGGPMDSATTKRLLDALGPNKKLFVMYGATEAAARLTYLPPEDLAAGRGLGSIGRAIPNVRLRVLRPDGEEARDGEEGELVAQGSNIMDGYWRAPEATAAVLGKNGYHTGDLVRVDPQGYIYVVGRKTEMIKSGAHRIAPKEIEDAIAQHAAVDEAAVVGIPDAIMGERIKAVVVLRPTEPKDGVALLRFLQQRLPPHKIPGEIAFSEALPKNDAGKVMKRVLKHAAQAAAEANPASSHGPKAHLAAK